MYYLLLRRHVAQWESIALTWRGSLVQSLPCLYYKPAYQQAFFIASIVFNPEKYYNPAFQEDV